MTPFGVYTPTRVLMGQTDAVAFCQSAVDFMFADLLFKGLLAWLDDMLGYAENSKDLLDQVLTICSSFGLKLNPKKCDFFLTKAIWCGKVVSTEGAQHSPTRIQGLCALASPAMAADIQQFVCATNWIRSSIPCYTELVAPLSGNLSCKIPRFMKELTADQRHAVVDHLLIWQRANVSLGGDNLPIREMVCEHTASMKKGRVGRKQKYTDLPERIGAVPASQSTTIAYVAHAIGIPPSTLKDFYKRGLMVKYNSNVKPKLTDVNKTARVKWTVEFVEPTYAFYDMYDYVHVDKKWFHATRIRSRHYLLPGEDPPHRSTQSKRFITKVMFLSAVARPRWDNAKSEWFDGKIGTWHFTQHVRVTSSSRNRPVGTIELRPVNVTHPVYKKMLIDNVIPAIKALWPAECSRTVFIQQDNAHPHVPPSDADIVKAYAPLEHLREDIVSATNNAWKDVDPWALECNFLTLQSCLREKCGRLPESVFCGKEIYDDGCTLLGQHDLSSVMLELSLQTARDLEMSDIFTALETLDMDDQDE
ncbi:hypothetical protein H257_12050 [Aphanomyces astaci]|uniref:Reverse transcriptase domain-containing protein n=1 Tax=Aphanomyces astaci TaxID=112090 RepID=W4FZW2_APHAT|nr:hypothetical protein H257_12050 [Aphanomyces astaci]ETV73005.1 hypothetical protein H257_12050 [Aphanomyces astaci]|eukprot:XP_009837454.1 hypothetical protein H257_12050 [Aphanomyces astaci]